MSPCWTLEKLVERCVSYFTLRWLSKKCKVAKKPHDMALSGVVSVRGFVYLHGAISLQSVLSFIASRSSLLIGELLLSELSETVVVQGNAPHDRAGFLMCHLIGNRASFLCTEAPMLRVPETNFLQGITSINGLWRTSSAVATS